VQVSASPQSSSNYVLIALSDYERANVHLALEIVPLLAGLRRRRIIPLWVRSTSCAYA